MADLFKALVLGTIGWVLLANLGDALKRRRATSTPVITEVQEQVPSATKPVRAESEYSRTCAKYDPVAFTEEQFIDIFEYAARTTGTPVGVLYAVWMKETGHLDGAGTDSGTCDVLTELDRRDRAKGTHHAQAMRDMAAVFDWKLAGMTCSCPHTDKVTGERTGYGGCCGPFQFSGAEIDDEYALPLGLDPMRLCDGALIAGWELRRHYEARGNWQAALSRYYGADPGGKYGSTSIAIWEEFHGWYKIDQRQPGYLIGKILAVEKTQKSLRYHRELRGLVSQ